MKLNLPLYSYNVRSGPASTARLVNCFPELLPPGAKTPVALTRAPGVSDWATVGSGPIRGIHQAAVEYPEGRQDYLYVISGSEWYYVDSTGSATLIGNTGTPVNIDMESNVSNMVVVNEPRGYYFNGLRTGTHTGADDASILTNEDAEFEPLSLVGFAIANTTDGSTATVITNDETTVTSTALSGGTGDDWDTDDAYVITAFGEIDDDDFVSRGAAEVEFLDNFLIYREPNSIRFFISDIGSVTEYDYLQFVKVDDHPDELNGLLSYRGYEIAFGTKTTEMYENIGQAGVPFERIINSTIEVGCLNSKTVAIAMNQVFWVADDYTVRRLDGLIPARVSTHAIEQKLSSETILDAESYSQDGHWFYCLTTSEGTYAFDAVTGEWSERQSYGYPNWTPRYHAQFAGMQLVGDWESNKIGKLDFDVYTEFGNPQVMEWTYQTIYAAGHRAFHDRFEIVLETGVGLTTGQGSDPVISLQKSDDGGSTWQALPNKTFGKRGERLSRAVWHNLGSARDRVYKATVSDPVPVTVVDTIVELRGGRL
jgi:hypothetical protein